jgi:hypothetical protein
MVDLTKTDRTEIANPESMCAMVERCYLIIYGHPSIMGIRYMNSWESVHAGYYICTDGGMTIPLNMSMSYYVIQLWTTNDPNSKSPNVNLSASLIAMP